MGNLFSNLFYDNNDETEELINKRSEYDINQYIREEIDKVRNNLDMLIDEKYIVLEKNIYNTVENETLMLTDIIQKQDNCIKILKKEIKNIEERRKLETEKITARLDILEDTNKQKIIECNRKIDTIIEKIKHMDINLLKFNEQNDNNLIYKISHLSQIENIVDNMLADSNINIQYLPDTVERKLYINIFKIMINVINNTHQKSNIELLGEDLSIKINDIQ